MKEFRRPQKMLGPSQVSVVLGFNKFQTVEQLKDRIENGYIRDMCKKRTAGTKDEERCRALYAKETNNRVYKCPFISDKECMNRFGGCGDGLVGNNGGVEIKCQYGERDPVIYFDHRVQAVAYMFLYEREWWDIIVCSIRSDDSVEAIVDRIYWKDYNETWTNKWYPTIKQFCQSVDWKK